MRRLLLLGALALSGCSHHGEAPRVLRVLAAADSKFRERPHWRDVLSSRIHNVSSLYDSEFNIRLELVEVSEWKPDSQLAAELKRRQLSNYKPNGDLVMQAGGDLVMLGFAGDSNASPEPGVALAFDPRVLVFDFPNETEEQNESILAHELAHMFGAWHSQKDSSLLHLPPGSSFDSNARQAIRLTRLAVLGSGPGGLGHETVDRLAALYSSTGADPGSNPLFQAYMFLGQELSNVERAEQAIEPLSRAVALSPADANAHYMLGKTDLAMQRFQDAAFEFRKVLDLNPRHASAWNNLGGTLVRQEHYEEAVAAFRKALEIEPANPMIRCNLAVALVHVPGHLDQGIAGIQDILRTNPDAPYAQQALKDALEFKQQEAAGHQTPGPGGSPAAKPDPAAAR